MSAAASLRPAPARRSARGERRTPATASSGARGRSGPTLGDLLARTWNDVASKGAAGCPVCGGDLRADAGMRMASCSACGSRLA